MLSCWYLFDVSILLSRIALEPLQRSVLDGVYISRLRNMLVAVHFLYSIVEKYGVHTIYSDGASWYPEACTSLNLLHRLHSPYEKSILERAIEYVRIEQNNLMIVTLVENLTVIYYMSTTGFNYLYSCTMV
jgi:hypothetical protein